MAPPASYVLDIAVTVTAMTPTSMYVFIRNENTREIGKAQMNSSGQAIYDLNNLSSGYSNGDRIVVYTAGEEYGVSDAHTVNTNEPGANITIDSEAETSTTSPQTGIG